MRQTDIDDGVKPGVAFDAAAEIQRLESELRKMKLANEILKRAARDPAPSARTLSDAVLSGELYSLWVKNRKVYGVWKLWKTAKQSGIDIGRDQTA